MIHSGQHKQKDSFLSQLWQIAGILLIVFFIRTFFFGLYQVPTGSMETTMLVGEGFFADKFTYLFSKPQRGHVISLNYPLFNYSSNKLMRLFQEYVWGPVNLTKRVIAGPGDTIEGRIEDGKPVIYRNGEKLDEPYLNKYPLIVVWKEEPRQLAKNIQEKAISLISQNKLSPAEFENYFQKRMYDDLNNRSYDSAVSFEKQPFYRIDPALIYKDAQGEPKITYPGTLINKPKGENQILDGKNHWDGTDVFYVKLGANQYWLMGDNRLNSGDSRMFGPVDGHLIHGRILFRIWSVDMTEDWLLLDLIKHPIDFWTRIRWGRFFQWIY